MIKRIGSLLPWFCLLALLGPTGCAAETNGSDTNEEGAVATAEEGLSGWGSLHGGSGASSVTLAPGNYMGWYLLTGSIVETAWARINGKHKDSTGWWQFSPYWSQPGYGSFQGVVGDLVCPADHPYMVGIYGQASDHIGSLGVLCGNGVDRSIVDLGERGGAAWGPYNYFQDTCDFPKIVTQAALNYGPFIEGIQINCGTFIQG